MTRNSDPIRHPSIQLRRYAAGLLAAVMAFGFCSGAANAQDRPVPDTYTATTVNMTPGDLRLKIDVVEWSDDAARAAAIAALTGDDSTALTELPTVGVVWRDGSGVGHALKYAYRATADDGSQVVTLVTDKPLDAYSFTPWQVVGASAANELSYSVIELRLDANGGGDGTMSLAAEVAFDEEAHTVSLTGTDANPRLLREAKLEPKPYWARGG